MKASLRLFLLLTLAALLVLLPACGDDYVDQPPPQTTAPETTAPPTPLALVSGGQSDYAIVRGELADDETVDAAIALYTAFTKAGVKVSITTDWEKRDADPADRPKHEILVGRTNRDESVAVADRLRYDDYAVEVIGDKLVICGGGSETTAAACSWFIAEYLGDKVTDLALERTLLAAQTGKYAIESVTLGGKPLDEYCIAVTERKFDQAAEALYASLISATGYVLPVVELADAAGPMIVVGLPSTEDCTRLGAGEKVRELTGSSDHLIFQAGELLFLAGETNWTATDAVNDFVATAFADKSGAVTLSDLDIRSSMTVAEPVHADASLRIMTFNIYGINGDYNARFPYISQTIRRFLPDIIGFQEANKTTHRQVLDGLRDVYAHVEEYHANGSTVNYTPILYRKDKLKVVESDMAFLRSRYTGTNTKSITWAVMERLETGERFIVTNLHGSLISASYNIPGSNAVEGAAWREDNIKEMCEKIDALKAKYGDLPTLSTGDYNFNSDAKAYRDALALGLKSSDTVATVSADRGIASYHKEVGAVPGNGKAIDMIFVNDKVNVYVHKIVRDTETVRGSDHCPVYADVSFAPAK